MNPPKPKSIKYPAIPILFEVKSLLIYSRLSGNRWLSHRICLFIPFNYLRIPVVHPQFLANALLVISLDSYSYIEMLGVNSLS